jgi:hypothetical protein
MQFKYGIEVKIRELLSTSSIATTLLGSAKSLYGTQANTLYARLRFTLIVTFFQFLNWRSIEMNICRSRKIAQSYSKKEKQRLVSNFVAVEWSLDLFKK